MLNASTTGNLLRPYSDYDEARPRYPFLTPEQSSKAFLKAGFPWYNIPKQIHLLHETHLARRHCRVGEARLACHRRTRLSRIPKDDTQSQWYHLGDSKRFNECQYPEAAIVDGFQHVLIANPI
jgi:hypothetical protein